MFLNTSGVKQGWGYATIIHMQRSERIIRAWVPMAFLATIFCGLVYGTVQQSYRQSANDPQVQLAEDTASTLQEGGAAFPLVPSGTVDIATDQAPYMIFFDVSGNPVIGNGMLDGHLPTLPPGVFAYTATTGEDRFTWEPEPGVRSAVVLVRVADSSTGFVMAGRSLSEVEWRESQLELMVFVAWVTALAGIFLIQLLLI